jgi:hypothetical protein
MVLTTEARTAICSFNGGGIQAVIGREYRDDRAEHAIPRVGPVTEVLKASGGCYRISPQEEFHPPGFILAVLSRSLDR